MDTAEDPVAVVAGLREEHDKEFRWPLPLRLLTFEVAGVDLVSLETRLAGCVHTWLSNGGSLHERGMGTVRLVLGQIEDVLPELTEDDSPQIWHRLHRVARLIVAHNTPPAETAS
ncbi:hypothetical protein ACFXJO_37045 [Streptomyces lavendulae]|uniref:hypothetical protein n=1 Tax=Streptomyces lavendulae TaxID=1914 RepID=UPI0036A4B4F8